MKTCCGLAGDSEIASLVINESEAEGEEARKFLEDVRVTFPQVLRIVKTRQVTYSILEHLSAYVQNLEKVGLLEEKEMIHLHDAVQTDLKKLLRNPPLAKMPKISDLLRVHPFLGALPSIVREPLEGASKELTKLRGVTIYREGSKANGIWLISNGVVKWTSRSLRNKNSLHPIFSHGSTLGLYEVLTGKPYICNMITDSVVHSFFIEAEKIVSLVRSDPIVEDFLWQESVICVAKLLLPQFFEKMTMQELRALVLERSAMNIYIRGENVEIPHHSIGFLLEGFIKSQDTPQELITSPAVLLPLHGDLSFQHSETGSKAASFCHRGSGYIVETRARVIAFDLAILEGDGRLRKSSSWVSNSVEPPRSQVKEHGGLMSWPEHFYMSRKQGQQSEGTNQRANSLSERAMQLSIFGSVVNHTRKRARSFPRSSKGESLLNQSCSRVPTNGMRGHPLVSTQSEGAATLGKSLRTKEARRTGFDAPMPSKRMDTTCIQDNSSDESSDDNELIVRIDSLSRLSFCNAS